MEVITIESQAFKALVNEIVDQITERFKPDSLMTNQQVMDYTGFGPKWLSTRKELIGYIQDGKEIRFRRSHVDAYLNKHFISRKK